MSHSVTQRYSDDSGNFIQNVELHEPDLRSPNPEQVCFIYVSLEVTPFIFKYILVGFESPIRRTIVLEVRQRDGSYSRPTDGRPWFQER